MGFLVVIILALPALAALAVALMGPKQGDFIRRTCVVVTLADAILALVLAWAYIGERNTHKLSETATTFRPEFVPGAVTANVHKTTWNMVDLGKDSAIQFYLGVDGLNIWLIVLTTLLMVPSVLISFSIQDRVHEYFAWLLMLGFGMLGVFFAFDIILFYVFFELTLVPLFFLIGIWGGSERRYAARKFFIFTLAGSVITFLGLLAVVYVVWHKAGTLTFSIPELIQHVGEQLRINAPADHQFWANFQFWVFVAMAVGFAVKVPLFPVHTWLPLAHVEAPTAGSVLLAGVLLKMGTYGFLRLALPLAPDACISLGVPIIGCLSVIGIIYGALCAKAQDDVKKLVAYSSVSHLGFCTLGMFALNTAGLTGSMLQMINHGLSTGGLFLVVGMLYERYHTRKIADYGGMASKLGGLSACMVFLCLSSVGLPGLNGFVGEALVFFGAFREVPIFAIAGTAGILLGAWYLMTMLRQVFFGQLKEPHHDGHEIHDLNLREICCLAPILVLCLLLGVYPQPMINVMQPEINVVSRRLDERQHVLTQATDVTPTVVAQQ